MVRGGLLALTVCFACVMPPRASAAECYNVAKGEPSSLTGALDYVIFPGPPNFKDVQGGDSPEPSYVLRLSTPICITGDESADRTKPFTSVQIQETDATAGQLHGFLNKTVTVKLGGQKAADSGHDHEPLVAWVLSAQLADVTVEYASAASTVRAFYEALGQGQGEVAALLIAPESRPVPAFAPAAMSRFYGALRDPIRLVDIQQSGPDVYVVSYHYAAASRACDGKAVVTTSSRAGANYIVSIRALNGC